MRLILILIATAAVLWGGYWFVGSSTVENSAKAWFEDRRAEGWAADYTSLETRGFPNRFDTTITELTLADPDTGVAWSAPFFQVFAFSYRPNHIIAIWPNEQTIASPLEKLTLTSEDMRASVVFEAGTSLTLDRATADLAGVTLSSDNGWTVALEKGLLATRQSIGVTNGHDLFFQATNLKPDTALRLGIDPDGALPDTFDDFTLDIAMGFDAPWDRFAIERARPQPTSLDLKRLSATWGQLDLRATGKLSIDPQGRPDGRITIKATNWRELLEIGVSTGMISEGLAPTVERALEILASLSGPANTIDAPLTFKRGFVSLGPIPLGPAPRLSLR